MDIVSIVMIIYLVIGLCLTIYWWNKYFSKEYAKAKTSEEGVEEGMAVNHLLTMMFLWPLFLACNLYYKKHF